MRLFLETVERGLSFQLYGFNDEDFADLYSFSIKSTGPPSTFVQMIIGLLNLD